MDACRTASRILHRHLLGLIVVSYGLAATCPALGLWLREVRILAVALGERPAGRHRADLTPLIPAVPRRAEGARRAGPRDHPPPECASVGSGRQSGGPGRVHIDDHAGHECLAQPPRGGDAVARPGPGRRDARGWFFDRLGAAFRRRHDAEPGPGSRIDLAQSADDSSGLQAARSSGSRRSRPGAAPSRRPRRRGLPGILGATAVRCRHTGQFNRRAFSCDGIRSLAKA